MNRYPSMVGAVFAGLMLLGLVAVCAKRPVPVAPGHAVAQRFEAGRLLVLLPHTLVHRFEFYNDTNQTLEISELKTSCGCTGAEASARSFAPGQSGWIEATATIQAPGRFETMAWIRWSNGERTNFVVGALPQISRELFLSTGSVDMDPGESHTFLLTCLAQDGTPPGPVDFQTPDGIEVAVGPWRTVIEADEEAAVVARFCSSVRVDLISSLDQIGHIAFSLESFPNVWPAELTIRTTALLEAHANERRARRKGSGSIAIPHAPESAVAPSSDASARP